jgi:hypothetical protein
MSPQVEVKSATPKGSGPMRGPFARGGTGMMGRGMMGGGRYGDFPPAGYMGYMPGALLPAARRGLAAPLSAHGVHARHAAAGSMVVVVCVWGGGHDAGAHGAAGIMLFPRPNTPLPETAPTLLLQGTPA